MAHLKIEQIVEESCIRLHLDSDGPCAKLSDMKADDVAREDAERAFMPYLTDVPKLREFL